MARKEYVSLFEKVAAAGTSPSKKKRPSPLTVQEQHRLDELEQELPLQAILMFRTMARKEVRRFQIVAASVAAAADAGWVPSLARTFPSDFHKKTPGNSYQFNSRRWL